MYIKGYDSNIYVSDLNTHTHTRSAWFGQSVAASVWDSARCHVGRCVWMRVSIISIFHVQLSSDRTEPSVWSGLLPSAALQPRGRGGGWRKSILLSSDALLIIDVFFHSFVIFLHKEIILHLKLCD